MSDTKTAPKAKAPKKPAEHPSYVEMITEAISALKERNGSSVAAIKKFIGEEGGWGRCRARPAGPGRC